MKQFFIPLTRGVKARVNKRDHKELSQYKWHAIKTDAGFYAARKGINPRAIYMHRVIAGAVQGQFVDHKDFDTLNNTRRNLRVCTQRQNAWHQRGQGKYKGVQFQKRNGKFQSQIRISPTKMKWLGYFSTAKAAAKAYDKEIVKLHGEFAVTNFPKRRTVS